MKKHTTKFIVNPNANLGQAWRLAADLRPVMAEFGGADWAGTVYPTHAIELTHQAIEDGYDLIIAAGGDGTVHEVINGLMSCPKEKRPRLGVVPLGSGNDFSHALGMDTDPAKALRQIFTGESHFVDIGVMEDSRGRREYWDNTIGIGFDAIVTIYSHNMPIVRGFLMYFAAVLKTIFLKHHSRHVKFIINEDETWTEDVMMITLCNGPREGGGFTFYPDASLEDGIFTLVAVKKLSRLMMLRLIPEFMKGTHLGFPQIQTNDFQTLSIHSDQPLYIHCDGEIFSGFTSDIHDLKIEIIPQAIEVIF
ncbi:MAG: diacylglycerol kinase family protein [Chloroflexota bacterium]|nr:diacylglycerol kinase family protein [Chloroflexota bacterium]